MKRTSWVSHGCVALFLASASSAAMPKPSPEPDDEPIHVIVLWDNSSVEQAAWSVSGYKCVEYVHGCPKNSVSIDTSTGDIRGCVSDGATPPTCSGTCEICSGGATVANICKKTVATDTCGASAGTGISVDCGQKATPACTVGGNAGPNGCGCPTPVAYPTTGSPCKIVQCETTP